MIRTGYEIESVPVERSMPVAPKSSRGVDKQACTEAGVVQENARILLANPKVSKSVSPTCLLGRQKSVGF